MKALIALTVLVAATMPTAAAPETVSPMEALSTVHCHPVIGTVVSVYMAPHLDGTDIVLDHIAPAPGISAWKRDGKIVALIPADRTPPTDHGKPFPAPDTYVGHEVAMWAATDNLYGAPRGILTTSVSRLMPLSAALADPKNTPCHP